ncbi:4959_t:CDS:2 [Diversispora eburnea]|uniref:4959_t:CDS:1 n=1 Tax=Diversispora eburnea TaxID=1213867 RepID=A0A9N8VEL9_9GLOM|nr:4959_t:CDS:2 [Diversispora eburnea]
MDNNQKGSRSWKIIQGSIPNSEESPSIFPFPPSFQTSVSKTESKSSQSALQQQETIKQKVPFTLKYQLHFRKNNQHSPIDVSTPQTTPGGTHNSGLLQELTFEQGKGQFLWASDGYHGNKKRRINGNSSPASPKPYDTKVPRPPNAFIIYHRTKSKELAKFKTKVRNDERHPSKTVAEMWREEPEEIKLKYQREADLALVEHKKKYPYYKYRPKKKDSKSRGNLTPSSVDSVRILDFDDSKEDSQVPIEHRKQASMESAFTVFELHTSSLNDQQREEKEKEEPTTAMSNNATTNNNIMNTFLTNSPPQTPPIWTEDARPNFVQQVQKPWVQPPSPLSQISSITASENSTTDLQDALSLITSEEEWNAFSLIFQNSYQPNMMSPLGLMSIENIDNSMNSYIVPTQNSSTLHPSSLPHAPPPTPTSPMNFIPWAMSLDSFADTTSTIENNIRLQQQISSQFQQNHNNNNNNN